MRHVKIYEEFYSDDELRDLLGDLSDVGHGDKFSVECNVFFMVPTKNVNWKDWPEWSFRNIKTEVYCKDDRKVVLEKAFEKVLNGEFVVEKDTYRDQMFRDVPELVPVLSKENTIKIAKKVRDIPPGSPLKREIDLYTLQSILREEIEALMIEKMKETGYTEEDPLKHLRENISYNVRYSKI